MSTPAHFLADIIRDKANTRWPFAFADDDDDDELGLAVATDGRRVRIIPRAECVEDVRPRRDGPSWRHAVAQLEATPPEIIAPQIDGAAMRAWLGAFYKRWRAIWNDRGTARNVAIERAAKYFWGEAQLRAEHKQQRLDLRTVHLSIAQAKAPIYLAAAAPEFTDYAPLRLRKANREPHVLRRTSIALDPSYLASSVRVSGRCPVTIEAWGEHDWIRVTWGFQTEWILPRQD